MDERFLILPRPLSPTPAGQGPGKPAAGTSPAVPFGRVLDAQLQGNLVRFSRHATERMASRGIEFNAEEMGRLQKAVDHAGTKGAKDSLVLLGDNALVVSVKNNTVVTVVDRDSLKGNLFTNIDSAIIA